MRGFGCPILWGQGLSGRAPGLLRDLFLCWMDGISVALVGRSRMEFRTARRGGLPAPPGPCAPGSSIYPPRSCLHFPECLMYVLVAYGMLTLGRCCGMVLL